jgi:hypothetical protein
MNELLTRELTNDELSLISGGGESDQNGFGLREIYDYWARQIDRMERLDNNGDGDGWDEIQYSYTALAAASGATALSLAIGGLPQVSLLVAATGAAFTVVAVGAQGIDTYGMKRHLQ